MNPFEQEWSPPPPRPPAFADTANAGSNGSRRDVTGALDAPTGNPFFVADAPQNPFSSHEVNNSSNSRTSNHPGQDTNPFEDSDPFGMDDNTTNIDAHSSLQAEKVPVGEGRRQHQQPQGCAKSDVFAHTTSEADQNPFGLPPSFARNTPSSDHSTAQHRNLLGDDSDDSPYSAPSSSEHRPGDSPTWGDEGDGRNDEADFHHSRKQQPMTPHFTQPSNASLQMPNPLPGPTRADSSRLTPSPTRKTPDRSGDRRRQREPAQEIAPAQASVFASTPFGFSLPIGGNLQSTHTASNDSHASDAASNEPMSAALLKGPAHESPARVVEGSPAEIDGSVTSAAPLAPSSSRTTSAASTVVRHHSAAHSREGSLASLRSQQGTLSATVQHSRNSSSSIKFEPTMLAPEETATLAPIAPSLQLPPPQPAPSEAAKRGHVSLLREQHRKLQARVADLEAKLAKQRLKMQAAGTDTSVEDVEEESVAGGFFVSVSHTFRSLLRNESLSDVSVTLPGSTSPLPAHRIVFATRGVWNLDLPPEEEGEDTPASPSQKDNVVSDAGSLADPSSSSPSKRVAQGNTKNGISKTLYRLVDASCASDLGSHDNLGGAKRRVGSSPDDLRPGAQDQSFSTVDRLRAMAALESIDLTHLSSGVASALVEWMYTDVMNLRARDMSFVLEVLLASHVHQLVQLKARCGERAVSDITTQNALSILSIAHKVAHTRLIEYATRFIIGEWDNIDKSDFGILNGQLLYLLLKEKTAFPLHESVRLHREDAMFLFLLEHDATLHARINEADENGDAALYVALNSSAQDLAVILLSHGALIDITDSNGHTLLARFIRERKAESALFLIAHHADLNRPSPDTHATPLHHAAAEGLQEVVEALLANGADPNARDGLGETPLHLAVRTKREGIIRTLVGHASTRIDIKDNRGQTPLWLALLAAALAGDGEATKPQPSFVVAKLLIDSGADINVANAEDDPLICAAIREKSLDAARFLIDEGVSVLASDKNRSTPLHLAAAVGADEIAGLLLDVSADLNAQDHALNTPLMNAILHNHLDVVARFLDSPSVDIERRNDEGRTALGLCVKLAIKPEISFLLLSKGADIEANLPNGDSLLHDAIRHGQVAAGTFLIENKANVHQLSRDGHTPLTLCIKYGEEALCEILCEHEANINAIGSDGTTTPLLYALRQRQEAIASVLVRHNCDVDMTDPETGLTALHKAILEKDEFAAIFLMRHNANVNANSNAELLTPLHVACTVGMDVMPLIAELLRNRSNINAIDATQQTPLHKCIYNGHTEVAENLISNLGSKIDFGIRDNDGRTIMGAALSKRERGLCNVIFGVNPISLEERNANGETFLHSTLLNNDIIGFDIVLKLGADVSTRTADRNRRTALSIAVERGLEVEACRLISSGADHSIADVNSGWSVAHVAASLGLRRVTEELIAHSANMDAQDHLGDTVLHAAVRAGHLDIVQKLVGESDSVLRDPTLTNERAENVLHTLCKHPSDASVEFLQVLYPRLRNVLNEQDIDGNTPLLLAFRNRKLGGARLLCIALVANGAYIAAQNNAGDTCFSLAKDDRKLLFTLLQKLPWKQTWMEGNTCQSCRVKFGPRTRRHHCRHCGRLLCQKCSSRASPIVKFEEVKPVRVCDACFDVLTGERA